MSSRLHEGDSKLDARAPTIEDVRTCLADRLDSLLSDKGGIGELSIVHKANRVEDEALKVLVSDASGRPAAVVFCPNPLNDLVAQSIENARKAREMLDDESAEAVLMPMDTGDINGLTYAVYHWHQPLSESRWFWPLQRRILRGPLFRWLRSFVAAGVTDVEDSQVEREFVPPLKHIATDTELDEQITTAAAQAIDRLNSGRWKPRRVFAHNDLWRGNILLDTTVPQRYALSRRFFIIDWPGADPQGYAIKDLVRLAESMRLPRRKMQRELRVHCRMLRCELDDAKGYLLASLGARGLDLGYLPRERFIMQVNLCCDNLFPLIPK